MKFIHIADVHLGAEPHIGNGSQTDQIDRAREIWDSLEKVLEICEKRRIEFLLISGDLFHRQPLKRELKELNYLFSGLSVTQVVMIAGNHDYIKKESYYRTFQWEKNVHMICSTEMDRVEFPEYGLAVYGFSYGAREITDERYKRAFPGRHQGYEILLAHGGDSRHIPMKKEDLLGLGYDYIAMGHIHKPQIICPDKIAYAGALEPIDKNDTGEHGYILGEITTRGTRIKFVPFASRQYVHLQVSVHPKMTGYGAREEAMKLIARQGAENIYKLILVGERDPEIRFDPSAFLSCGNVIEVVDETRPAYQFEKIERMNKDNILGMFIEQLKGFPEGSMEHQALCEGVQALMQSQSQNVSGS